MRVSPLSCLRLVPAFGLVLACLVACGGTVPGSRQQTQIIPPAWPQGGKEPPPYYGERMQPPARLDRQALPRNIGQPYTGPAGAAQPGKQVYNLSGQDRHGPSMGGTSPAVQTAPATRVALLLPLSGAQAKLGMALQNAAQLAVFDNAGNDFELMPRDTGDTPEGAQLALRDALASGAKLIIGPLFSSSVSAIKPLAQSANVPVLALSNDTAMAGENIYITGFSPAAQVERIIGFAQTQGVKRIAALVPRGGYGDVVQGALAGAAARSGAKIVRIEQYDPAAMVMGAQLDTIAKSQGGIDGILIAEGGDRLRSIATQLAARGIDLSRIHLLGTGLWDEADVGRGAPALAGGWFAAPDNGRLGSFIASYEETFGQKPPRIASLAYDAAAMAVTLSRRAGSLTPAALSGMRTFEGIDGPIRLTAAGRVERSLAVYQVTPEGIARTDEAPGL
ncbi:MAG: ABC transporter substrate-binding protein [Alphaproteobacteria bacterium]|nr:ABC transporter substrate-binding protein [Alphaproteobacteria bacterium]